MQPGVDVSGLVADKFNLHLTVGELKARGVLPQAQVADHVQAVLVPLETAPGVTEYWLGLNNFYVITRYNKSTLYAKVAQELADELRLRYLNAQALQAAQPAAAPAEPTPAP